MIQQPLDLARMAKPSNLLRFHPTKSDANLSLRGSYPGFSFFFAYPHFVPFSVTKTVLESPGDHPLKARYKQRYDHIDSSLLWPSFNSMVRDFKKGILRSVYQKRLKQAFFAALREEGLDSNGRKLDASGNIIPDIPSPIRGSIMFTVLPTFSDRSPDELKADCTKVIKRLASKWIDIEG
jgi:hypothetical protein